MDTITGITAHPRKPGRFSIDGNSGELGVLSIEAIERLHLAAGMVVDEPLSAALQRESAILATYDRALNMLAARGRAAAELRRLLIRKGEPPEYADAAIERLRDVGFIDDENFARQFARSRATGGGVSRRRVQQELARRGVSRDVSSEAIAEVFAEEAIDEQMSLMRVATKKLRTLGQLDAATQRRRLYGYLARRGYDADDIARALRELIDRTPTE
jgi:regulatory protein